jgi:hypothetical protein
MRWGEPSVVAMRQDAASTFLCKIWKRVQDLEDILKIGADFFQILMNSSGQGRAPKGIIKGGWKMEDGRWRIDGGVV